MTIVPRTGSEQRLRETRQASTVDPSLVPLREGGMSDLYTTTDVGSGLNVVVKVALKADFERCSALIRERELLVRLVHPGVVRALDWVVEDERVCLVLERVCGVSLDEAVRLGDVRVDEARVRDWGLQLADILVWLHAQQPPVIHRDLKPSNIMLTDEGRLVLLDFGAARVVTPSRADTVALGTPGYAPPEQYGAETDARTDVYALGATLFELLSRRSPAEFGFSLPSLISLGVAVSPEMDALVRRACQPAPADRYPSAQALRDALQRLPVGARAGARGAAVGTGALPWARVLVALTVAWTGLAVVMPVDVVAAISRRIPLLLGASSSSAAWPGAAVALLATVAGVAAVLLASGRASRRARVAMGSAAVGVCLAWTVLAWRLAARDAVVSPPLADAPRWTRVLGPVSQPAVDVHIVGWDRPGARHLMVRDRAEHYVLIDASSGVRVGEGAASPHQPVFSRRGEVLVARGAQIEARSAAGAQLRTFETAGTIEEVRTLGDALVVVHSGGGVERVATTPGAADGWCWRPAASVQTSAIVAEREGRILVLTRPDPHLCALDAVTGRLLWSRPVDSRGAWSCIDGPPGEIGAITWVSSHSLEDIALADGRQLRRVTLALDVPETAGRPLGASRLQDGRLLVSSGAFVWCLDPNDGSTVWRAMFPGEHVRSCDPDGGAFTVVTDSGKLIGLDPRNGRTVWERWPGGWGEHIWPTASGAQREARRAGPVLVVSSIADGTLDAIRVGTGETVWRRAIPSGTRLHGVYSEPDGLCVIASNAINELVVSMYAPAAVGE